MSLKKGLGKHGSLSFAAATQSNMQSSANLCDPKATNFRRRNQCLGDDDLADDELPKLKGAWGSMAQQQLEGRYVSRAEMSAFLESSIPRTVPKALSYVVLNKDLPLVRGGVLFLGFGICLMIAMVSDGTIREQDGSLTGFLFLSCWILFFAAMIACTLLYRRRKTRLLSEGILALGTITNVKMTGIQSTSGDHKYLTVEYPSSNGTTKMTYETYRELETIARKFMDQKMQVRMLIDPLDPKHVICPELLTPLDAVLIQVDEATRRPYKYRSY